MEKIENEITEEETINRYGEIAQKIIKINEQYNDEKIQKETKTIILKEKWYKRIFCNIKRILKISK